MRDDPEQELREFRKREEQRLAKRKRKPRPEETDDFAQWIKRIQEGEREHRVYK